MNPNYIIPILDELIEIYKHKKMYKFIHIPIQSASDKILKDMNRNYKSEQVIEIIKRFREEIPNITIATDIITGYPTEKEEDHKKNLEFLENIKPDVLNISKFSSHKKTKAGELEPLKKSIINKRASELMEVHRRTAENKKKEFLNKEINVFVNNKISTSEVYESRDDFYNIVLINSKDKSILGKNIKVKIIKTGVHHMIGEKLKN